MERIYRGQVTAKKVVGEVRLLPLAQTKLQTMRTRKPIRATKVATASHTGVTKHTSPTTFREGKIRAYLNQLGIDVREYTRMSAIRHDMRMLNLTIS